MTARRIDAGPLLVLAGAVLLLISLFLPWYEPRLQAWTIFEVLDLLLAAGAVVAILAALGLIADFPGAPDARVLPWVAGAAFVLVVATLLNRPPIVAGDVDVGLWLALAAVALMAAGTVLGFARVSIAFDVAARERRERVAAVDSRATEPSDAAGPTVASSGGAGATPDGPLFGGEGGSDEPTEPLPARRDPATEERPPNGERPQP